MRIIGGSAAGRVIDVPKGLGVRPTPDKVRQAIFNSLGNLVDDAEVLELFGGSGALSLECLSRGAKSAVCVEKSPKHARFIRSNVRSINVKDRNYAVVVSDVFPVLANLATEGTQFDLIMADPPFGEKNVNRRSQSFSQRLLDDTNLPKVLRRDGLLVLGHAKRDQVDVPSLWRERKLLKHGDSVFRMLELSEPGEEQALLEPAE